MRILVGNSLFALGFLWCAFPLLSQTTLIDDNFDDNDTDGWSTFGTVTAAGGSVAVTNGALVHQTQIPNSGTLRFQTDIRFPAPGGGIPEARLIFSQDALADPIQGDTSSYSFLVKEEFGQWLISLDRNDLFNETILATNTIAGDSIMDNVWYRISVTFADGQIDAALTTLAGAEIQAFEVNDTANDVNGTFTGLYTNGASQVDFDNFSVVLEGGGTPSVAFAQATGNGAETVTSVDVAVNLSAASQQTVTVDYAVTGGSAGNGADYDLAAGTLTFTPDQTTRNISFTVTNDAEDEGDETIEITLSNPGNAILGNPSVHTYTILDDDEPGGEPLVQFSQNSSSGSEAIANVALPVTITGTPTGTITIDYAVTGGSATGGNDYTFTAGTLSFPQGTTTQNVPIAIVDDAEDENTETIQVTLSNPTNAQLGSNDVHTYSILDNDGGGGPLDVSVFVQEALPGNIATGMNRTDEWVRFGVPLPDSADIASIDQLGLSGADDYQFQILATHASGNARWVLVDSLVDFDGAAGLTLRLTGGAGNVAGPDLATDNAGDVAIDTGPMEVTVSKTRGSIVESLTVDGQNYISNQTNESGVWMRSAGGTDYFSNLDTPARTLAVTLETNGPVRATVRIDGYLYDTGGTRYLRFRARLHFLKGARHFLAEVTLANDYQGGTVQEVDGAQLRLDTVMDSGVTYSVGGVNNDQDETFSNPLNTDLHLAQGYSTFRSWANDDGLQTRWVNFNGYRAFTTDIANPINNSGDAVDYARGYATLDDGTRRLHLIYKQLSGHWSGGYQLGAGNGTFAFNFLSDRVTPQDQANFRFSYFAHETREFLVAFGNGQTADYWENRMNYPLFAVCDVDQYACTGAIWNRTRLPNKAQIDNYYLSLNDPPTLDDIWPNLPENRSDDIFNWGRPQVAVVKIGSSSSGGPDGNYDFVSDYLIRTILARLGSYYLLTDAWVTALTELAITRGFDYKPGLDTIGENSLVEPTATGGGAETSNGIGAGIKFYVESEHPHWLAVLPWYYMTGKERYRDAIPDILDHREWLSWGGQFQMDLSQAPDLQERWYTYELRSLNLMGFFDTLGLAGGDDTLLLSRMQQQVNTEVSDDANQNAAGWAPNRGFFFGGAPSNDISTLFFVEKHMENLLLVAPLFAQLFPNETDLHKGLRDRLLGFAYFTNVELYPIANAADTWFEVQLFVPPPDDATDQGANGYITNSNGILAYAYERTGNDAFLDDHGRVVPEELTIFNGVGNVRTNFQALRFIYDLTHRDKVDVGFLDLGIDDQGGGTYRLTWTNPANVDVAELVLKFSTRTIVENLDFNPCATLYCGGGTRGYAFDPATNVAFWAADEPTIGPAPGDTEITLTGLPPGLGADNFRLKYLNRFAVTGLDKRDDGGSETTVQFATGTGTGSEATTAVNVTVTLSAASQQTVTVGYSVTGGTATAGDDFVLAAGTLTFDPQTTTRDIALTIVDDQVAEPDETLVIGLSDPTNAMLGAPAGFTYTIDDDDAGGDPCPSSPVMGGASADCADLAALIAAWNTAADQNETFSDTTGEGRLDLREVISLFNCVGACE
ncbi:YetA-like protein [Sulfidibacter corallicola]|uniref:Calx-beta domain-containing protein n=1 Tax=Sulfidibacter corallicola TaxID=2818388 RepID=A0A8A4TJS6_SULCO|nr:Calx-beta domain-containing protein [Sulfidibacter corallicola]QTD49843.1 hypothetical protein J3U87_30035 [Sulfidibacter corallicola]